MTASLTMSKPRHGISRCGAFFCLAGMAYLGSKMA